MGSRLYHGPGTTEKFLEAIFDGAATIDDLKNRFNTSRSTVFNGLHDLRCLGLVIVEDDVVVPTTAGGRFYRLNDLEPVRDIFIDLAGVDQLLEQIEDDEITYTAAGRLIGFATGSDTTKESTFKSYGRTYANWIEFLSLGYRGGQHISAEPVARPKSANNNLARRTDGPSYPTVWPNQVFTNLDSISDASSYENLVSQNDFSERTAQKIVGTAVGVKLVGRGTRDEWYVLTERGETFLSADKESETRRQLVRDGVLTMAIPCAYCNRIPDEQFHKQQPMNKINDDFDLNLSESTIKLRTKRLVPWLSYAQLIKKVDQSEYQGTDQLEECEVASVSLK